MIEELRSIQHQFGYLPADQLQKLASRIRVPLSQIHAVASFYPHFHLTPPAQAEVRVCSDMSCHLRGAIDLKRGLERAFQAGGPEKVAVRNVSCLGRCDQAPAMSINDQIFCAVDEQRALTLVRDVLSGRELRSEKYDHRRSPVASDPYKGAPQYSVVRQFVENPDWAGVIATLKAAGLRGMGGAGFPTGSKWEIVRNAAGKDKYIVCNADESEPGTIKDRFIMENVPYLLIEGMIIAGLVTGARRGILYIRHEYEQPKEILQEEIDRCYRDGLLGANILGSALAFDLEIFVSPGGYICGEESALLEAIEGKRAEPRNKPPFPGTNGLWNQPTAINNVETFTFATVILARGADWFKAQGTNGATGMKFVGISGDVNRPGIYEVPMGTKYSQLIYEYAGGIVGDRSLLGYAPSGPSSGYLPASMADLPLDWNAVAAAGSMVGSGAIVVCAEGRCMLDMALNAVRFYRNESCGKCVPCRVGSQKLVEMLTGWTEGRASAGDLPLLDELTHALKLTSICGLGQVVPVPIQSVLKHFREVVDEHINHRRCSAGVCFPSRGTA
ncbi:MAG TPA: NAD(P)H-dependent oxidoreductase subunit E [Terriglobales bacterium]|nr:NAD(P)H-dependent oxidoreductase subunit E [Terriglobales bacterium]